MALHLKVVNVCSVLRPNLDIGIRSEKTTPGNDNQEHNDSLASYRRLLVTPKSRTRYGKAIILFSALADNFGSLRPFPQDSAPPSEPFADKTITDTQCKVPEDITFRSRAADKGGTPWISHSHRYDSLTQRCSWAYRGWHVFGPIGPLVASSTSRT